MLRLHSPMNRRSIHNTTTAVPSSPLAIEPHQQQNQQQHVNCSSSSPHHHHSPHNNNNNNNNKQHHHHHHPTSPLAFGSPLQQQHPHNRDVMACLMSSKFHRTVLFIIPVLLAFRALMFHWTTFPMYGDAGGGYYYDHNCSCHPLWSSAAFQAPMLFTKQQLQLQQQQRVGGMRRSHDATKRDFIDESSSDCRNKRPPNSFELLLKSMHAKYAAQLQADDGQNLIHVRAFPRRTYPPSEVVVVSNNNNNENNNNEDSQDNNSSTTTTATATAAVDTFSFPCIESESDWYMFDTVQRQPAHDGFFYVKTHKTASTTVMGIAIRIAKKAAERHNVMYGTNFTPCKVRFEHWPAQLLDYSHRELDKSFLFAIIREPTQRAVSMFFHFEVSRAKKEPTDSYFQNYLTALPEPDTYFTEYYPWGWTFDHYLHYLSPSGYTIGSGRNDLQLRMDTVNEIMDTYDFIGITERLDESLVALQMILGLKTSDILYSSAKGKGHWDDKGFYIQPSFVSDGMEAFFGSSTWSELSQGDYLMYMAANASLDKTIEGLGQDEFQEKLRLFRYAKKLVLTNCTQIKPAFSAAGRMHKTDCLLADAGCGNGCFDQIERDFQL